MTTYTYDAGNVTKTRVQKTGDSLYLESSTIYNDSKNFPKSATDVNGTVVSYSYNDTKGLLNSTTTPLGTVVNQYNAQNDRLTSTYQTGVAALNYTYGYRGTLDQIKRKTFRNGAEIYQAYEFDYNDWGQKTEINIRKATSPNNSDLSSGIMLASYDYDDENRASQMTYGNGDYITYEYDLLDRPIRKVYYNGDHNIQAEYLYVYSADGQLAKQYAISGGNVVEEYSFEYDSLGRLIRSREDKGSSNVQRTEHLYDTANRLTKQSWQIGNRSYTETYTYNDDVSTNTTGLKDGSLNTFTAPTGDTLTYSYDVLKRPGTTTVKNDSGTTLFTTARSYKTSGNKSSNQISGFSYRNASGGIINYNTYEYDAAGNIKKIYQITSSSTQLIAEYTYDAQNQLTQEKRYAYSGTGTTPSKTTTVEYTYDTAGNIMAREGTDGIYLTYSYDDPNWVDLLTGVGLSGFMTDISYDDCGNPSNWYNGTDYTDLTWAQGRRLMSLKIGNSYSDTLIQYAYDMDGIRTSKIEGSYRHDYVTQNGKVVRELVTNKTTGAFVRCLDFFYDASGNPFALRKYKDASLGDYDTFHYVLNYQGDVVQINYQGGTVYAKYTYDAWGNVLTATGSLASINPLRYRGYYYDTETGWYYLQSRYYDPAVGRFINADCTTNTGQGFIGYNMFAYCNNNPVANMDFSGEIAISTLILIGSAVIGVAAAGYTAYQMRKAGYDWFDTAFYSIGAGLYAFCTIYSLGASAYELYSYYCMINGMQPITEIGKSSQHITALSPSNASTLPTSSASTYSPPKGGGGVTDRITVGNMTITFGHGGRHLDNSALTPSQVNHAISTDVMKLGLQVNEYCGTGRVQVDGLTICYTAFRRSDTLINVGTYHILGGK